MQTDEDLAKLLPRFEAVEQHYDGLNGKIIKWTLENGNESHDPSVLAFVVGPDGRVFTSLMNGQQYQASSFTKWAREQVDAFEKAHPSTRLPFLRAKVTVSGGEGGAATCEELDAARADEKPVMLYFGRGHFQPKDKTGKKQTKASQKFEKGPLNSKSAAQVAASWVLLRFDLADESHAALAKQLGVEAAPTLLYYTVGAEAPVALDGRTSGAALTAILKKHAPASGD